MHTNVKIFLNEARQKINKLNAKVIKFGNNACAWEIKK